MPIAQVVAPGMNTVGLFLPYTPLHNLLFSDQQLEYLILTSANPSGLPILYRDDEAYSYLEGIADFVLSSNRKIDHPIDDSVVQLVNGEPQFFRRARGYVPDPIFTAHEVNGVIALGPQQKNTFAIGRFDQIFIGPHIGDMETIEVTEHYMNEFRHLMKWMGVSIEAVAVDKHPLYETGKLALELDCPTIIPVQHHHAHHVACMEDNHLKEPCFGIILDGTGYGLDGNIWGFELLYGNPNSFERLGHLSYHHLPGGEKAVKEPWRNAVGFLLSQFGMKVGKELSNKLFVNKTKEIDVISTMVDKGMNSPLAGTCGRLFDVVSAITGVSHISTYDGEAAIRFSELVDVNDAGDEYYPYELTKKAGIIEISVKKMILKIIKEVEAGKEVKQIALKFHETIVQMCLSLILVAAQTKPSLTKKVVLSGGSFHNRYLATRLMSLLKEHGFQVFTHKNVPCNDGGISLGQIIIAAEKYKQMRREMKNVCWSSS
ncbi:Sua5/YciO/YrdC/YwlC family protein [Anaerobacillus sp. CMMVII]|uniref:Kae1-like domain-containing protein n=1 Tax=Anaerobacillus sp. CMMVII TaxID=2755588 RepID=UPI0028E09F61|nr:Sua5/YciO/YrdC/YwlC family protein [Anaerobacillus sp. CMMVII]